MTSADFTAFYRAVHGHTPFPWQERLAAQVLNGGSWPETLCIPTACGKTSTIDIAVFALAAQADLPAGERTAPLRLFFAIDRRLVVDDVTRHACQLAEKIATSDTPLLVEVRERLNRFGGAIPLAIAALRGGMYRSNAWADMPNQPLIVVSTVDQVGSRLLFRGYGVSDSARPVHAGLVANDSLMIIDEAHLSQPFLDTLRRVTDYQRERWLERRVAPGLRVVRMSATMRGRDGAFTLEQDDYGSALKERLEARKIAELKETGDLEGAAAQEAVRLAKAGAGVVGVVLNTVSSARAVFESIEAEPDSKVLLTGRVRPYDRDRLLEKYLDRMKAGRARVSTERLFVVATQTVEVGADLDFDALVTEAAPLDALRQRFGRLNRLGRNESSDAVILKPKRAKGRDWIYGESLEKTWEWLEERAAKQKGRHSIDFGIRSMEELYSREGNSALNTREEQGPVMFPAHLDAWVQTNPPPAADPDVTPFLHGASALAAADVQIVWRGDLDGPVERWGDVLALAPPVSTEALSLPIGLARRWLAGVSGEATDIEGAAAEPGEEDRGASKSFLIWRGPDSEPIPLRRLRPGDTIVVRSDAGGTDEYGWNPNSGPVRDIGDECANERAANGLGRFRRRLHAWVMFPFDAERREDLTGVLRRAAEEDEEALAQAREIARETAPGAAWDKLRPYGEEGPWLIAVSKWPKAPRPSLCVDTVPDETDESDAGSLTGGEVTLKRHTEGVVQKAKMFAERCGLDEQVGAAVALAAQMHDEGKRDDRFQILLDPLRDPADEPLAKGPTDLPDAELRRRRELSGYPKGARHEFASVAVAETCSEWPAACDRDLVLYLIGTHHGYGRPFPPVWAEDPDYQIRGRVNGEAVVVKQVNEVASIDSAWIDRFWRVTRKYGWWGLAYLEAMVRRADCVRSREEQEGRE
jgi:CRISPR-associated endonuclease/helicase Cas3